MAAHAIGRSQIVVIVDVALRAGRRGVRTHERKPGHGVIESRLVGPGDRVVATGAVPNCKR